MNFGDHRSHLNGDNRFNVLDYFIFKNLTIKTLKVLNLGYYQHHYLFMKSTDLKYKPVSSLKSF